MKRKKAKSSVDYTKYSIADNVDFEFGFREYMSQRIDQYRKKNKDDKDKLKMTRAQLSKLLHMDTSTLTRILNCSQKTRKRDIIIAVCLALELNIDETNTALKLYPMAPLDSNNPRDKEIENAIIHGRTVAQLNGELEKKYSKLDFVREKKVNNSASILSVFNEDLVNIHPYCVAEEDSSRSLHERYRPDQYDFYSEMIIHRKDNPVQKYQIILHSSIYKISHWQENAWTPLYCDEPFYEKYHHVPQYKDADLLNEIAKLQEYTDQKARYIHSMCADTKNYISRFDAINNEGKLIIYGETFGFDAPELCEYYQIEASQDGILFSVSNCSKFMERYLGENEWRRMYGPSLPDVTHRYESLAEIPNQRWYSCFQSLISGAQDLLVQLQQKKVFLFDVNAWWNIDDIMDTFKVKEAFSCIPSDDGQYDYIPQKEYIIGPDGKPITIEDLKRASELDIRTIEELCSIRKRYGTLEGFLQIDTLTEQKGKNNE